MKLKIFSSAVFLLLLAAACKKDNYNAPSSTISGRIVYQGEPLGVRSPTTASGNTSSGVQLELWQRGYQLFSKIPVYVAQDGTFSASVFDGDYKLVRLKGSGPWEDNTDTIAISLKGSYKVDVPVNPFFTIKNETFTFNKADTTISGTFNIIKVVQSKSVDKVSLSIGFTTIVDVNNNVVNIDANGPADITQPVTLKQTINPNRYNATSQVTTKTLLTDLLHQKYAYVRVAVKTVGVNERLYTMVKKVPIVFE
jgi:hypothetical protein